MLSMNQLKKGNKSAAKIRIVYLIDFFSKGGGMERQLGVLIRNLDREKFHPVLFTLREESRSPMVDINCKINYLGVTSLLSFAAIKAFFNFVQYLRQHRIDILQIFSIDSNIFGVPAGRLASVKRVVIGRRDTGLWYTKKRRHLTNLINRLTDFCIANSVAVKDAVNRMESVPAGRTVVIYNGVSFEEPSYESKISRAFFGIPHSAPVVGIVANFREIKRIDRFLEVFASLERKETHAIIVGTGGSVLEDMEVLAVSLGVTERLHIYHTVDEVQAVIKLFDVGVLTSESEGLSNALIEYAHSAIPAVAFNVGGNSEVIDHDQTGYLIPPYELKSMKGKLNYLLDSPEVARKLGQQGAKQAGKRFLVEHMVTKTELFYTKILSQGRRQTIVADDHLLSQPDKHHKLSGKISNYFSLRHVFHVLLVIGDILGLNYYFRVHNAHRWRILMYHGVAASSFDQQCWTILDRASFVWQMDYLRDHYAVQPAQAILDESENETKYRAVITFDDGLRNTYVTAWPILKERGLQAVCFVLPGLSETSSLIWADEIYQLLMYRVAVVPDVSSFGLHGFKLDRNEEGYEQQVNQLLLMLKSKSRDQQVEVLSYLRTLGSDVTGDESESFALMSLEEIKELSESKQFEIAPHSQTHPIFSSLDRAEQDVELSESDRSNISSCLHILMADLKTLVSKRLSSSSHED
jgi:glycosyltransferase involved in cell wall biosynthesis/peptidoglycan/xylan/chitin deacetylase (PgdA/CDA1 family)